MRRITSLSCAGLILAAFVACGGEGGAPTPPVSNPPVANDPSPALETRPPEVRTEAAPPPDSGASPAPTHNCDSDGRCWEPREHRDMGFMCLSMRKLQTAKSAHLEFLKAPDTVLTLKEGDRPYVLVDGLPCLSSSCSRDVELECSLEETPFEHTLHVTYRYQHGRGACTEDCRYSTTACRLKPLKKGHHTIRFGTDTLVFDVPGELSDPCLERSPAPKR